MASHNLSFQIFEINWCLSLPTPISLEQALQDEARRCREEVPSRLVLPVLQGDIGASVSTRQCETGSEQTNTGKKFSASRSRTGQHVIATPGSFCVSLQGADVWENRGTPVQINCRCVWACYRLLLFGPLCAKILCFAMFTHAPDRHTRRQTGTLTLSTKKVLHTDAQ